MLDILSIIPGRKKQTQSGWYSFNAPCCINRGHNADKRNRGGLIFSENNWSYHCFNCRFKCGFALGKSLSSNTRLLLAWCGLDKNEIEKLSLESLRHRDTLDIIQPKKAVAISFEQRNLPDDAVLVDLENSEHALHIEYLRNKRGLSTEDYPFYCEPNATRQGVIIPYFYNGQMVGHNYRFYDDRKPKYVSDRQPGYVFNIDAQRPDWSVCILVEGEFDAISVGGCAYMGNHISDVQIALLARLHRTIILVPDREKTGLEICEQALELGYKISIPDWDADIKDVNDAVRRYGKIQTLLSILRSATTSKIKVELARKKLL